MDESDRLRDLYGIIEEFIEKREWDQYHRPKDVAMALSIEAGELMELYLWDREPEREDLEDEVGDIFFFLLDFCIREGIDPEKALRRKMEKNREKYPIDLVKGKDHKYTRYQEG